MNHEEAFTVYERIKYSRVEYKEETHCSMLLKLMSNPDTNRYSAFCVAAGIGEDTFYKWLKENEVFKICYCLGKMYAREAWEKEGSSLRDEFMMPGTSSYKFEYWRMIGWSKFGIGKNARIRLDLNPNSPPNEHYSQLIAQASQGDFTAGEIKQLMEAINVGLNTHQVCALQKEIDQLKSDLTTMSDNMHGHNTFSDKGIA